MPFSPPLRCSFCQKKQDDVRKLIAGPEVFICDECVEVCVDIMAHDARFQVPQDRSGPDPQRPAVKASAANIVACSLCGTPTSIKEVLPIENRGVLCGACVDAIEDAIAQGTRIPPTAGPKSEA